MEIQKEIRYYAENLNVKFAKANSIRLRELEKKVRRYITRALQERTLPEFTAMDLTALVLAIMEIQELRELKQFVLDKFQNTKDKNLKAVLRRIDKIIKRKIIEKINI